MQYVLYIAVLVALAVGFCWLNDRFTSAMARRRNPPEKIAADRRAYEQRLLQPDWSFYERHLQRPAPQALRELFSDHVLIVTQGIDYSEDECISTFEALDEQGLIDSRPWLGFDAVAIATSDFGDPIYLRPGPAESDTVYITHHDGGDTEELAPDVATFLERLRHDNRNA